jgi:4-hydroxybenzoate polyprenyltransferase
MLSRVRHLLEMIRFSHTIFALPFSLLAAVMAWTTPGDGVGFRWSHLLGILICMTTARSAAMAFNRLVDRKIDAQNPRTAGRHLPAGKLTVAGVVVFVAVASTAFFLGTLLFLPNPLPTILAIPVLLFLFAYSLTKRFTAAAHFWLGASLMLAPVSTWIALRGEILMSTPLDLLPAIWLGAAVFLWVAGFDMIYACQDADFDVIAKLHSIPASLGVPGALRLASVCHFLMCLMLLTLPFVDRLGGPSLSLGPIYGTGVLAVVLLLAYEHWIVRPDDLTRVNVAFFNVNAVVSFGLFAVTSIDLLLASP